MEIRMTHEVSSIHRKETFLIALSQFSKQNTNQLFHLCGIVSIRISTICKHNTFIIKNITNKLNKFEIFFWSRISMEYIE